MLLLDEPLANLDAKLRVQMREEIRRTQKELGIMSIYVTHDQEEAMSVSDRLAVFDEGRLVQLGKPQEIYLEPNSLFVADFIGKANFFPAKILARRKDGASIELGHGGKLQPHRMCQLPGYEAGVLEKKTVGRAMIRPERITLSKPKKGTIPCTISRAQFLGTFVRYVAHSPHAIGDIIVDAPNMIDGIGEGSKAGLTLPAEFTTLFYGG